MLSSEQRRDHEAWGLSPFTSPGFQNPRGMPANMLAYPRPGGYMPMPVGLPSFFPYHPIEGHAAMAQRQDKESGFVKVAESPESEKQVQKPSADASDATATLVDDLLVRGVPSRFD